MLSRTSTKGRRRKRRRCRHSLTGLRVCVDCVDSATARSPFRLPSDGSLSLVESILPLGWHLTAVQSTASCLSPSSPPLPAFGVCSSDAVLLVSCAEAAGAAVAICVAWRLFEKKERNGQSSGTLRTRASNPLLSFSVSSRFFLLMITLSDLFDSNVKTKITLHLIYVNYN